MVHTKSNFDAVVGDAEKLYWRDLEVWLAAEHYKASSDTFSTLMHKRGASFWS